MMSLLELPTEVVQNIIQHLICGFGVKAATAARCACKSLDREIRNVVWLTRAFEDPTLPKELYSEHVVSEYLLARTLADSVQHQYNLTTIILETAKDLQKLVAHRSTFSSNQYIQKACLTYVRTRQPFYHQPALLDQADVKRVLTRERTTATSQENLLALAVSLGFEEVMQSLVAEGVRNLNTCFGSPLENAAAQPDSSMLKLYLEAIWESRKFSKPTTTSEAYLKHYEEFVATFRRTQPRDFTRKDYESAICCAVTHGTPESVELLMKISEEDRVLMLRCPPYIICPGMSIIPNLSMRAKRWSSVLHFCAMRGRFDIAKLALDHGADPNVGTPMAAGHITTLELTAEHGQLDAFKLLLEKGTDIHLQHRSHKRMLYYAVKGGSMDIVHICLDAKVTVEGWNTGMVCCHHPLSAAVKNDRLDFLKLLLSKGFLFDPDSDLDRYLTAEAKKVKNPELDAVIDAARARQHNLFTVPA